MTTGLIYLIGILIAAFIVYLMVEVVWERAPKGALTEAYSPETKQGSRLQGVLSPLGIPVQKYAPSSMLRKTQANLYWAQMVGKWQDWNAVQFIALQLASAVGGFLLGMFMTKDVMMSLVAGYIGWVYPGMSVNGVARRTRRLFVSQLPEFVQLVAAQMAANVSMEEAIQRTSKSPGLVGQWMQKVLRQAQGRNLLEQMQREAQESLLPELIGMSVQIAFIRRGTAQQELMSQMAMSIAAAYIGEAEQRAEKLGSEMVVPMVIFYFVPFLVTLLMVMAYPVMTNLFGVLSVHILPATVRDRLGFAFFLFAGWVSLIGAWQHPTLLALFSGLHNMVLAFLYAIRKPETTYDRTGLWLGLIAAFLPMPFVAEKIPTFLSIVGLCGYALIFWSLTALGQSFGIAPADRGLVINGPYSLVRHPLYLGELILRGALLLGTAPLDGAVALIILLMVQVLRIVREEKVIAGYSDYASHVRWRLIPFIF